MRDGIQRLQCQRRRRVRDRHIERPRHCGGCGTPCRASLVCSSGGVHRELPHGYEHLQSGVRRYDEGCQSLRLVRPRGAPRPTGVATCVASQCKLACNDGFHAVGEACVSDYGASAPVLTMRAVSKQTEPLSAGAGTATSALKAPTGIFQQIAAGNYHTCAIRQDGSMACWAKIYTARLPCPPAHTGKSPRATATPAGSSKTATWSARDTMATASRHRRPTHFNRSPVASTTPAECTRTAPSRAGDTISLVSCRHLPEHSAGRRG